MRRFKTHIAARDIGLSQIESQLRSTLVNDREIDDRANDELTEPVWELTKLVDPWYGQDSETGLIGPFYEDVAKIATRIN